MSVAPSPHPDHAVAAPAGGAAPLGVVLPAGAFHALRTALLAGDEGELHLRDAGFAAGTEVFDAFGAWLAARAAGHDPAALPLPDFLDALSAFAGESGWGRLTLDPEADGLMAAVRATGWFEVEAGERPPYPSCHFTTGLLSGFLGRLAGRPVAVLEIQCASCGEPECRFLVGSPEVLERVYRERYPG